MLQSVFLQTGVDSWDRRPVGYLRRGKHKTTRRSLTLCLRFICVCALLVCENGSAGGGK